MRKTNRNLINMTGMKFGSLVAVRMVRHPVNNRARWVCTCDCGYEITTDSDKLRAGLVICCPNCRKFDEILKFGRNIPPHILREYFSYDDETQTITRLKQIERSKPGLANLILSDQGDGRFYYVVAIGRLQFKAHRMIWCLVNGEWPPNMIDHKDGDGLNNRLSNLRLADKCTNMHNKGPKRNSKSGLKGAFVDSRSGKFFSSIRMGAYKAHLGTFTSSVEAARAYDAAALALFGSFARINNV